jgi:tetratricopeptide (TPR) repeat protein
MRRRLAAGVALLAVSLAAPVLAQTNATRDRAMVHYKVGLEEMRAEQWENAIRSFHQATDVDPKFEMAYYSIGRARMAQKRYDEAVSALTRCRDLYQAQAGRQFSNAHDAQRMRRDQIIEIDEILRQFRSGPQTPQVLDRIRELELMRREYQLSIDRGNNMTIQNTVPAFVSLSLGSAYFRAGKLADAEREYKVTIEADPKSGEAHQNLAVVYLETGRIADAERAIAAAKKVGFSVNPLLVQDVQKRKRAGSF